ncbi:MAG: hypothetical protein UU89_C0017G0017 [Parcubacteria group bacterium GW2011_GWC2_42_11]|nr:MAG: hypothetical protein UU89_C0017G0017 [Parcubacteria group bacterium GW2011_GWC2_42_11]
MARWKKSVIPSSVVEVAILNGHLFCLYIDEITTKRTIKIRKQLQINDKEDAVKDEIPRDEYVIRTRGARRLIKTLPKGLNGRVEKRQILEQFVLLVQVPASPHVLFTKFTEWCRRNDINMEQLVVQ